MSFKKTGAKKDICPVCETEREIQEGFKSEILTIRGESVGIEARVEHCTSCGEFFADVEAEEENFQKAYRKYRENHNLLQPEEIQDIRKKYGVSQRLFSRLLGWGEITLHRYESGALQDETHNTELLLMKEPDNFRILFERNRSKLRLPIVQRIESRLAELLADPLKRFLESLTSIISRSQVDMYSGFNAFDYDKLKNAILFFTKASTKVFRTKLNKLLWYFDFRCFRETRISATGSVYIHLPLGPVPDNYDLYLADLVHEQILDVEEIIFDGKKDIAGEAYSALIQPNLSIFSREEIECLEKVQEFLGHLTSKQISDLSHSEDGYKHTKNGEKISYEYADKINIK